MGGVGGGRAGAVVRKPDACENTGRQTPNRNWSGGGSALGSSGRLALLWTHIRFITGRISEGSVRGDSGPLGARVTSPNTTPAR